MIGFQAYLDVGRCKSSGRADKGGKSDKFVHLDYVDSKIMRLIL